MKSTIASLVAAGLTAFSLACFPPCTIAAATFTENLMGDTKQNSQGQTTLIDVDLDGDLDWLMGTNGGGIFFFENTGKDAAGKTGWAMHKIAANGGCETSGKAMDINGDGYPDHLSGQKWLKNPGKTGNIRGTWAVFTTGSKTNCSDAVIGDWNHDERLDVAFVQRNQTSAWYEIPKANPEGPWIEHAWPSKTHSGLAAGDFDKNGMLDAVVDNILYLSKNKGGTEWQAVTLPYPLRVNQDGVLIEAGDIDADGDMDLVHMGHWTSGAAEWLENDGTGKGWKSNALGTIGALSHSANIADIDNDGDLDIEMGVDNGASFWFEQTAPKVFKAVKFSDRPTHDMRVGDVDGDGDLDMIAKPWGGGAHYFWQNTLVDKDASKKMDWTRGPIGSHNPHNPNRIAKAGCMDPKSANYDPWALHGNALTTGCGTTNLILTGSGRRLGKYPLTLRAINGRIVSGQAGYAKDVVVPLIAR